MDKTLMSATLQAVKKKLESMEYGRVIIIKYGENKVDIEIQKRERLEGDENGYHKG